MLALASFFASARRAKMLSAMSDDAGAAKARMKPNAWPAEETCIAELRQRLAEHG